MAHYQVNLVQLGALPSKPLQMASAISIAITALRSLGHHSIRLEFSSGIDVHFYGPNKVLLGSIGSSLARPVGRPPSAEPKPAPVKPFKFNGRSSATGWYRCRTLTELDLAAASQMIGPRSAWDTSLVYMDRDGVPLLAVLVPGVETEVVRLARITVGRSSFAVDRAAIGCKMSLGCLVDTPPPNAVAVFVLLWHPHQQTYLVLGKRLLAGLQRVPYEQPQSHRNPMPPSSGMSWEAAKDAYERREAGFAPRKRTAPPNTEDLGYGHVAGSRSSKSKR